MRNVIDLAAVCEDVYRSGACNDAETFARKVAMKVYEMVVAAQNEAIVEHCFALYEYAAPEITVADDGLPTIRLGGRPLTDEERDESEPAILYDPDFEKEIVSLVQRVYGGSEHDARLTMGLWDRKCKRAELLTTAVMQQRMECFEFAVDEAQVRAWWDGQMEMPTVSLVVGQPTLFG